MLSVGANKPFIIVGQIEAKLDPQVSLSDSGQMQQVGLIGGRESNVFEAVQLDEVGGVLDDGDDRLASQAVRTFLQRNLNLLQLGQGRLVLRQDIDEVVFVELRDAVVAFHFSEDEGFEVWKGSEEEFKVLIVNR